MSDARVVLALWRCIRQMPERVTPDNFDDIGALIAPLLEHEEATFRSVLKVHLAGRRTRYDGSELSCVDPDDADLLQDRNVHDILGEALARSLRPFKSLLAKAESRLTAFVAEHSHSSDNNVDILVGMLALGTAEAAFLRLATALCYSTIDRTEFNFVSPSFRVLKAIKALCGVRSAAALEMLAPHRPLARSGLFENLTQGMRDFDDLLALSARGQRLLSVPFATSAEMSAAILKPLNAPVDDAALEWPHLEAARGLLRSALLEAVTQRARGVNVLLHGAPGTGKTEFASRLVLDIGAAGFAIDHIDGDGTEASRADRLANLHLSQTFASQHERAVLVLDEAEDIFQDDYQSPFAHLFKEAGEGKAWTNALLEANAHPVVWISNKVSHLDPAYLRRFTFCIEFPTTPLALRRRIVADRLGSIGCSAQTKDAVATREETTPAMLASAVRFAVLSAPSGLGPDLAVRTMLDQHAKAAGHRPMPLGVAQAITRFDLRYLNVAGNATPQRLLSALQVESSATLLFAGPSGTGKTQFAAEIAERLGRHLVVRTASDVNSMWYGESEANVARMFRNCDPKSELLFLDEAEVLLGAREATSHRADRAVTSEFLRWLEAFEGIFICATNHMRIFDGALMRRFMFRLDFKPLDRAQREELFAELALASLPGSAPAAALDSATEVRLARLEWLTPGDFANVARRIHRLGLGAQAWLDELETEHEAKERDGRVRIGFV